MIDRLKEFRMKRIGKKREELTVPACRSKEKRPSAAARANFLLVDFEPKPASATNFAVHPKLGFVSL
jgi:hypothetical protein